MDRNEFRESEMIEIAVDKQIQARRQKQVDEVFPGLTDGSIAKEKRLLKKLAKA